ncbi:MAG: hypothetical protein VX000_10730, partial [Myxococcota bacterium]|nr:hypothetical protein [Myxococcota bacterium]
MLDAFEERPTIRIEIAPAGAADGGVVAAGSAADVPTVPPTVPDADPGSSDPGDGQTAAARPLRIFVGLPSGAVPSTRSAEPVWDASAAA